MEDDYLPEIQHYCNFMYETLLTVTAGAYDLHTNKEARKLAGIPWWQPVMLVICQKASVMTSSMTSISTSTRLSAAKSSRCSHNSIRWLSKR